MNAVVENICSRIVHRVARKSRSYLSVPRSVRWNAFCGNVMTGRINIRTASHNYPNGAILRVNVPAKFRFHALFITSARFTTLESRSSIASLDFGFVSSICGLDPLTAIDVGFWLKTL